LRQSCGNPNENQNRNRHLVQTQQQNHHQPILWERRLRQQLLRAERDRGSATRACRRKLDGKITGRAISLVGVAEATFDYWLQEGKRAAGKGFSRTGLYTPSHYFQSAQANLAAGRKAR